MSAPTEDVGASTGLESLPSTDPGRVGPEERSPVRDPDEADVNGPMLVKVVQVAEDGQGVQRDVLSKVERLRGLEACDVMRGKRTGLRSAFPRIPLRFVFEDRELRAFVGGAAGEQRELPNEVVEGGPEVVGEFPDPDAPGLRWGLDIDPQDVFAGLRVELTEHGAFLVPDMATKRLIKESQVLVGALELHTRKS
jgi:hypothetical protein